MERPLISIVTINYNNKEGLVRTIDSVLEQSYQDYQYIIIDGGSVDGSAAVIREHQGRLEYWVSEKDTGIFDAMNKGIAAATGKYLFFLNSGDYLASADALQLVTSHPFDVDILYGNVYQDVKGRMIKTIFPSIITARFFYTHSFSHQASFIKKELFEKYGNYNSNYKIVSDWEFFFVVVCKYNCSIKHIPVFVSVFNLVGVSHSVHHLELKLKERAMVLEKNFPYYNTDYNRMLKIEKWVFLPHRLFKRGCRFIGRLFNINKAEVKDMF